MYTEQIEREDGNMIRELGKRYAAYRRQMGYTQRDVAIKSEINVLTISRFETGASVSLSIGRFIKLLRAIDCLDEIDKLLPDLPESPRAVFERQRKAK